MISCEIQVRVRYGETDRMGYAYYGYYPFYYEMGRTELLRKYGMAYKTFEDNGILLPVKQMHVEYIAPAHYDEILIIRTSIKTKPSVKIVFHYDIYNSNQQLINKASTELVFVDANSRRPCKPPKEFIDLMDKLFS